MENSFINNVNTLANLADILQNINTNIEILEKVGNSELGISKVVELETGIIAIRDNLTEINSIYASITKLSSIANNLDEILQVDIRSSDVSSKYSEIKNIATVMRKEFDTFFIDNENITHMYEEILSLNNNINLKILSLNSKESTAANSAAIAVAAKDAINNMYQVYLDVNSYKDEILLIADKLDNLISIENIVDEKYETYLQILPFKAEIINVSNNIQDFIASKTVIESNMETSLRLLTDARESLQILNTYKSKENKTELRLKNIEITESLNYSKLLTRIKIIEDST